MAEKVYTQPPFRTEGGEAMIQHLKCRFLPWHNQTWTGRKSETGYVWESICSCGTLWAVKLTEPHAWTAIRGEEFEAAIGYVKPSVQSGLGER